MATASTPASSIAIPSDVHHFAANVSPRGVDLEGRLDLSLDALIKERRKEHKQLKKQEEAKKQNHADKRKTPKQQKPQQRQKQKQQASTVKGGQKAQRKALVDKNRGLLMLPVATKDKMVRGKTKTSIAATTAKLRRQMQADKAKNSSSRFVVSPRTVKGVNHSNAGQHLLKKKHVPQHARKVTSPPRVVQPKSGKKQQTLKQQPKTQAKALARQVVRSNSKKAKLNITISAQTGKKKSQKKQKNSGKGLLPGKLSQALAKKTSAAKKVVKHTKNRKATAAKTTQIVRKVPGQRKKN